jgi:DNA/RNA-binding domain of Phe-tRNA-synthetase-like protein
MRFRVDPRVLALRVQVAYLRIIGLRNRVNDPDVDRILDLSVQKTLDALTPATIETNPEIRGFRLLHDAAGQSNKKHVASPENLLILLLRRRSVARINLLVDIYNMVSIQTCLALGAHDVRRIDGDVTLRITTGGESFRPLGSTSSKKVPPGEYAYIDSSNDVLCRLETRQCEKTKVQLDTEDCLFIVQGSSATSHENLKKAVDLLAGLVLAYCGGSIESKHIWPQASF